MPVVSNFQNSQYFLSSAVSSSPVAARLPRVGNIDWHALENPPRKVVNGIEYVHKWYMDAYGHKVYRWETALAVEVAHLREEQVVSPLPCYSPAKHLLSSC